MRMAAAAVGCTLASVYEAPNRGQPSRVGPVADLDGPPAILLMRHAPVAAGCRFSAKKNFFKFRVSPIVSGAVYVSYMVFLITVLDRQVRRPALAHTSWKP